MRALSLLIYMSMTIGVYCGGGLLFHYYLKGDEVTVTASSLGILLGWPFLAMVLIFVIGVVVIVATLIFMWWEEYRSSKRIKDLEKKYAPLNDAVDKVFEEAFKKSRPK